MMARRGSGWLASFLMLGLCLGLALVVYREVRTGVPETIQAVGGQAVPLPDLPAALEFAMAPAETFSTIVARPLFSPSRRPPPEGTAAIEIPEPELHVTLFGVIISSEEQIAIIKPKNGSQFIRLTEGDSYQGWTVDVIEPHRITFRRGDVEEFVEMTYDEPPQRQRSRRKQRKIRDKRSLGQTGNRSEN